MLKLEFKIGLFYNSKFLLDCISLKVCLISFFVTFRSRSISRGRKSGDIDNGIRNGAY